MSLKNKNLKTIPLLAFALGATAFGQSVSSFDDIFAPEFNAAPAEAHPAKVVWEEEPVQAPRQAAIKVSDLLKMPAVSIEELTKKVNSGTGSEERQVAKAANLQTFTVKLTSTGLEFQPKQLNFADVPAKVVMTLPAELPGPMSFFVRDQHLLKWDEETKTLTSKGIGQTEVYMVYSGKMYIVPVTIAQGGRVNQESSITFAADFEIPESLVSLDNLLEDFAHAQLASGLLPSSQASSQPADDIAQAEDLDVEIAVADVEEQAVDGEVTYNLAREDLDNGRVVLQVIDQRSRPEAKEVYPVASVKVRILGTKIEGYTDNSGQLVIEDLPSSSRFFVSIEDPHYRFRPTVSVIQTTDNFNKQVHRIKVLNNKVFETYATVFDILPEAGKASFCGRLLDHEGKAMAGYRVELNVNSHGAYYFNQYGPSRPDLETGVQGRFCFFNIDSGLATMSIYRGDDFYDAIALPILSGTHLEEDFDIVAESTIDTVLGVLPPMWEQLNGQTKGRFLTPADFAEITVVGPGDELTYKGPSHLSLGGLTPHKGRIYGLVKAAEYETVLVNYNFKAKTTRSITPLLPRGFIEDLYHELFVSEDLQAAFDPAMGTVVTYYGLPNKVKADEVQLKLIDQWGREIEEGWFFGDSNDGMVKSVFFNLNPGMYSFVAQTSDGYLLDMDTVIVDYWTTSILQIGSQFQARLSE
jgi:hypothetical protein